MANKKPLRISDDVNDLQTIEFQDGDIVDVDGIINPNGELTFEDNVVSPAVSLSDLLEAGGGYAVKYGSNSNVGAGKWLEIHRNILSNEVPFVVPEAATLVAISVAVKTVTTITFGIYKNGTQIETIVLTAVKKAKKVGLTHSLVADDELSVKVESGSSADPVLHLILE